MDEKLDKLKKDELIEMVKDLKENGVGWVDNTRPALLKKINLFRKKVRERNFILDKELPKNLGGGEIYTIDQIYQAVQDISLEVGLDFSFEVISLDRIDLEAFKPATGAPQHISTVTCVVTFEDIDTGEIKTYTIVSQGSDAIDKSVNGASTYAFRNWFTKNFTPRIINGELIQPGGDFTFDATDEVEKTTVKTPVFIPAEKKEEIVKELTQSNSAQVTEEKTSDVDKLTNLIYEYRELSGNDEAGANKLEAIINKNYTEMDLLKWTLSFENAVNDLKKGN